MRKLKKSANSIFENSMKTTAKIKAKEEIEKNKIFTTVFYFYGKARSLYGYLSLRSWQI